jgi:hypothetical protein
VVGAERPPLSPAVCAAPAPSPAAEAPPPCLIVNPRSFRASRGLAARAVALASARGAQVVVVEGPAALDAALASVLERAPARLLVLAGDGTVRAIVERLARLPPGASRPDLLLLPGGRTNLTAADLLQDAGTRSVLALLERALAPAARQRGDAAAAEERSPVRIEQAGAPTRHGFFLAGALLDQVIRHCHRRRDEAGGAHHRSPFGTPGELLGLGLRALAGRSGLACPALRIDAGARGRQGGPVRLLLVTTLLHRRGLLNPYAARGSGDLRVTSVAQGAPRFWRSLPRLLTGRYSDFMNADEGYLSGRCERLEITGLAGYTLDGEEFDADPARPLVITAGPRLRFLAP